MPKSTLLDRHKNLSKFLEDEQLTLKKLAIRLDVAYTYLTCVLRGSTTCGRALALDIERVTKGAIKADDLSADPIKRERCPHCGRPSIKHKR
jgi:DNA-binding transcriptional regulator YdaS (Cro superfamily)